MSFLRRLHQDGNTIVSSGIHIRLGGNQLSHHLGVAVLRRPHQRCRPIAGLRINISFGFK
jgi:hypothetical protein